MTVTAIRPKAAAASQPAPPAPSPGPSRRRGFTPLTPMRQQAAKSMRRLAQGIAGDHPDLAVHQHVRDAARTLEAGNEEAAQRHLRAAMFALTPQSLMRNGIHIDDAHIAARQAMHGVHRHLLLVKDIADTAAKNQAAIRRDSYGDDASSPPMPQPPVRADPDAGYGPGALAQRPTARQPGGDRALNAPARTNSGGSDPAVADPASPQPKGSKQFAYTWDDLATVVELSARTAQLEVTPAPRGKLGGPGLYDVKGMGHTFYEQQIVKALIEKRGMDPHRAYAVARGAIRKWSRGGAHVHGEVRAAAARAEAGEVAKQARAKAVHGHAVTWDDVAAVVELAAVPRGWDGVALELAAVLDLNNPAGNPSQPRVQSGPQAGQFTTGQQQTAHQQHVAHVQHLQQVAKTGKGSPQAKAQAKAMLLQQATQDKAKAAGLMKQIAALQKVIAAAQKSTGKTVSASSNVTKSNAPAKTAATAATTAASAPAATASTASTAAKTASTTAGTASSAGSAASSAASKTASSTASATASASAATKALPALQQQYKTLMAQAAQATAQAAKL